MPSITTIDGVATIINFLTGTTSNSADAAAAAAEAANGGSTSGFSAMGAGADILGTGSQGAQMFQQFAANSSNAGAVAGSLGKVAGVLGLAANVGIIYQTANQNGVGSVTTNQIASTIGFENQCRITRVCHILLIAFPREKNYDDLAPSRTDTLSEITQHARTSKITRSFYKNFTNTNRNFIG